MRRVWSEPVAEPADLAACRALLRGGSRTFYAASHVLPRAVRDRATALYAFCRLADDAVDLGDGVGALAQLRLRLDRIYSLQPMPHAADRAFAEVVHRFAVPRAMPEALLEGFEWDAAGRRYRTLDELHAYAARVAGTVGAMMALLMGVRAPDVLARACDLGVAMQLTNIARDVGEDARAGRLYLPLEWLRQGGVEPDAWMAHPVFTPALSSVVQRVLDAADMLYRRAATGIADLPPACRPGMHAARLLYAEIGREVERCGLDSVSRRAVVPASRKLVVLAQALCAATLSRRGAIAPPLEQTRFLVESVPPMPAGRLTEQARSRTPVWDLDGRAAWLIDLFERLERRERLLRASTLER
jgi:phytoene synthase